VRRRERLRKAIPKTRGKKQTEEKHALRPIEIKDLRNFVECSFREMEALESQQNKQEQLDNSKTLKPLKADTSRSKHIHKSVQDFEPQTKASLYKSQEDSRELKGAETSRYQTMILKLREKEEEKQRMYDEETQQINERLNDYRRRQDAASMKNEARYTTKMLLQMDTERPEEIVNNRRLGLEQEREERLKELYIKKARAIENSKMKKEKSKKEKKKAIIAELEKRKKSQAEQYKSAREREREDKAAVQERINRKEAQHKTKQDSIILHQQKGTGNELNELNEDQAFKQKLQMENSQRINRINEYKRNKIIEKHMLLSLKNDQRKAQVQNAQNDALAKNLILQKDMDLVYDCLGKMKKADPRDPKKKKLLMDAMNRLNKHFHLGLDLIPKSEKRKVKDEEESDEY